MARNRFRGGAQAVAKVVTVTVGGTAAISQVYTVTVNLKEVAYTSSGVDTNTTIAVALHALLEASDIEESVEVTWTLNALVITGTAATPGNDFTNTSGATGTGTLVTATATASSGPNHWDSADNWSLGTVPVDGEDLDFEDSTVDIKFGLNESGVSAATVNFQASYTGKIGNPGYNGNYFEYRDRYLRIQSPIINVGYGGGGGSAMIRLDNGSGTESGATTYNVFRTGSPTSANLPSFTAKNTRASSVLNAYQGSIGFAILAGETAALANIRIGYVSSQSVDVQLFLGSGVTLTTVNQNGGGLTASSNVTTLNQTDGTFTLMGTATLGTLNGQGGTIYYRSSGTLTSGEAGTNYTIDCSRDNRARTFTNLTLLPTSGLLDPFKTITFTNPCVLRGGSLSEYNLDLGSNFSLQRS